MGTSTKNLCQSCSMPLDQDPNGGGTNADGTRSTEYCSFCYVNGQFHDPDITLDQFVKKLEGIMAGMNIPEDVVNASKAILPSLKRWSTN